MCFKALQRQQRTRLRCSRSPANRLPILCSVTVAASAMSGSAARTVHITGGSLTTHLQAGRVARTACGAVEKVVAAAHPADATLVAVEGLFADIIVKEGATAKERS